MLATVKAGNANLDGVTDRVSALLGEKLVLVQIGATVDAGHTVTNPQPGIRCWVAATNRIDADDDQSRHLEVGRQPEARPSLEPETRTYLLLLGSCRRVRRLALGHRRVRPKHYLRRPRDRRWGRDLLHWPVNAWRRIDRHPCTPDQNAKTRDHDRACKALHDATLAEWRNAQCLGDPSA